jgi:hypothetical protein
MKVKPLKIKIKEPTPSAADRLYAQQQKNRKAAGLPDPSEYKKKLDMMKSENYEEDDGPLSQEQLDELSPQTKSSYVAKAKDQIKQSLPFTKKSDEYRDIAKNFIAKRKSGIAKASKVDESKRPDRPMPKTDLKVGDYVVADTSKEDYPGGHKERSGKVTRIGEKGVHIKPNDGGEHEWHPYKIVKKKNVSEGVTLGGMVGRGNIHSYDRNPGPKDGNELENVPFHAKTEKQKKLQNALTDLGKKMKETHPKLREAKDSQEYDYEGDMAKSDLRSIMHHAKELHDMIDDTTNLAEWCQSKITLSEDYLSTVANYMRSEMNEDTLEEGRASQRHPLEGHEYHKKSNEALVHIAKDAHAAAEAMKGHNTDSENKYRDQANDSATVRHFRQKNGMPDWYKKKYGHVNEEVMSEDENDYRRKIEKNNKRFVAATKRQQNPLTNVHTAQTKQKPVKEDAEQIDEKKKLPGLWANIHAKRKRGESPAKPGDKDYPKTLNIEGVQDDPKADQMTTDNTKFPKKMSRKAEIVKKLAKGKEEQFQANPVLDSDVNPQTNKQ